MRVYFMLAYARRVEQPNPVLTRVFHLLRRAGYELEIGVASEAVWRPSDLKVSADLYVLKSHTPFWLSLAEILHRQGARILNPYRSCVATQNKLVNAWMLNTAGVRVPETWIPGDLALLRSIAPGRPMIIKPYMGRRHEGIVVVQDAAEAAQLAPPSAPVLVQRHLRDCKVEIKVTVIGEHVFAIRREARRDGAIARVPYPVAEDVRSVALQCGRAFCLGLYGMDMLLDDAGPIVIDLDYFPSYVGVAQAAPLIAEYIQKYARGDIAELSPSSARARGSEAIRRAEPPDAER